MKIRKDTRESISKRRSTEFVKSIVNRVKSGYDNNKEDILIKIGKGADNDIVNIVKEVNMMGIGNISVDKDGSKFDDIIKVEFNREK